MRSVKRIQRDLEWLKRKLSTLEVELRQIGMRQRSVPERPRWSYLAEVDYLSPTFNELGRRFPAYVNPEYECTMPSPVVWENGHHDFDVDDWRDDWDDEYAEPVMVKFVLVHLNRCADTEAIITNLHERRLRPASFEELLGFARELPEAGCTPHPTVALGSVANARGGDGVACIWSDGAGRRLDLCRLEGDWNADFRFLAVPLL